jgi:hypothetical protein
MGSLMDGDQEVRELTALWLRLCNCGGPQPSRDNPRMEDHLRDCPYRLEVEGDVNSDR